MSPEEEAYADLDRDIDPKNIRLVGFKLGDELYAVDVLKIVEIIRFAEITSVPRTDDYVLGVMNLRGRVIPVVDLRLRFHLEKFDFDENTSTIVVKFNDEFVGFVVDSVTEVIAINKKMVNPNPPLVGTVGQEYILGIFRFSENLIFLLDIDRVIFEEDKYGKSDLRKIITDNFAEADSDEEDHSGLEWQNIEQMEAGELDKMIAEELSKREKETEEVLKTKNDKRSDKNTETVKPEESDKDKNLDKMIAEELSKREKETEVMLKQKKKDKRINNVEDSPKINNTDKSSVDSEKESINPEKFKEIKELAKKIINGENIKLDADIKDEVKELLTLTKYIKEKTDKIEPAIKYSRDKVPAIATNLEKISKGSEDAAVSLMESSESINAFYEEMVKTLDTAKDSVLKDDYEQLAGTVNDITGKLDTIYEYGYKMIEALEFEDVSTQKISRIIQWVADISARFASILGYVKVKNIDIKESMYIKQSEVDNLLKDFGF